MSSMRAPIHRVFNPSRLPFKIGDKVKVKRSSPHAGDWPERETFFVIAIEWRYGNADPNREFSISIASQDEIDHLMGATTDWPISDLELVADPEPTNPYKTHKGEVSTFGNSELYEEYHHWNWQIAQATSWGAALTAADEFRKDALREIRRRGLPDPDPVYEPKKL